MEKIKLKLSKDHFDVLMQMGLEVVVDGRKYIHLPQVYEIESESYNLVIEHYNDSLLPDDVKKAIVESSVVKSKEVKWISY